MIPAKVTPPKRHSNLEQIVHVLRRVPQFSALPTRVLEAIGQIATPVHYEKGQCIYLEGTPADALFLLEDGWVKSVRMTQEGREQGLLFVSPVDLFGDIAVFAGVPYPGSVIALEPVKAWRIPAENLLSLVTQDLDLATAVIRHLSRRVLYFLDMVEDLSLRNIEARLAKNLLIHAKYENGQLVVLRRKWATLDEMAVRLGTVRDVLSRTLRSMEKEGLLKIEKNIIYLLDPSELSKRASKICKDE